MKSILESPAFYILMIVILTALMVWACPMKEPSASLSQKISAPDIVKSKNNSERFKVTRVSVIQDDLAYRNKRGIYVIIDNQTGKEYVGVSGIGISETVKESNLVGKVIIDSQYER